MHTVLIETMLLLDDTADVKMMWSGSTLMSIVIMDPCLALGFE